MARLAPIFSILPLLINGCILNVAYMNRSVYKQHAFGRAVQDVEQQLLRISTKLLLWFHGCYIFHCHFFVVVSLVL
jgi:hypothetical protein